MTNVELRVEALRNAVILKPTWPICDIIEIADKFFNFYLQDPALVYSPYISHIDNWPTDFNITVTQ